MESHVNKFLERNGYVLLNSREELKMRIENKETGKYYLKGEPVKYPLGEKSEHYPKGLNAFTPDFLAVKVKNGNGEGEVIGRVLEAKNGDFYKGKRYLRQKYFEAMRAHLNEEYGITLQGVWLINKELKALVGIGGKGKSLYLN